MNAQTRVFEPAFVFSANWQMAVKEGMVKVGNAVCMIAVVAAALLALALPPVRPSLPPVAHADTETSTNVQFSAWQESPGRFRLCLTCRTTPTNNVQMAFGTDIDGDGTLSLSESDLIVGWDCGAWFVQYGFDGERIEHSGGANDMQTFACVVRLNPGAATPVSAEMTVEGVPVLAGVDVARLYRREWNMVRLTGRGLADSAALPEVRILPDPLSVIVR